MMGVATAARTSATLSTPVAAAEAAAGGSSVVGGPAGGAVDAGAPPLGGWKTPGWDDDAMEVDPPRPPLGERAHKNLPRSPDNEWAHLAGLVLFPPPPPQEPALSGGADAAAGASGSHPSDGAGYRTPPAAGTPPSGVAPRPWTLPPLAFPPPPWSMAMGPWLGLNGEPLSPSVVARLPGAPTWLRRLQPRHRPPQPPPFTLLTLSVASAAANGGAGEVPPAAMATAAGGEKNGTAWHPPAFRRPPSDPDWYSEDLDTLVPPLVLDAAALVRVVTAVLCAAGSEPEATAVLHDPAKARSFVHETELAIAVVAAVIERRPMVLRARRQLAELGADRDGPDGRAATARALSAVDPHLYEQWRSITATAATALNVVTFPLAALPRSAAEVVPQPPDVPATTFAAAATPAGAQCFFAPAAPDGSPPADVPPLDMALELLLSCASVTTHRVLAALVLAARARRVNATLVFSAWTTGRLLVASIALVAAHDGLDGGVMSDELYACGLLDPKADLGRLVHALSALLDGNTVVNGLEVQTFDELIRVRAVQLGVGVGGEGRDAKDA